MAERVANLNHVLQPGKPAPTWGRTGILRMVQVRRKDIFMCVCGVF